jgi:hypothetical protein
MGKLIYGAGIQIDFDDRALAHLHIVISSKLRRGEKFFFSWQDDGSVGSGRSSIWLEPSIPLYFKFLGSKHPDINRAWIEALVVSGNSTMGLTFIPEPGITGTTSLPKSRV